MTQLSSVETAGATTILAAPSLSPLWTHEALFRARAGTEYCSPPGCARVRSDIGAAARKAAAGTTQSARHKAHNRHVANGIVSRWFGTIR